MSIKSTAIVYALWRIPYSEHRNNRLFSDSLSDDFPVAFLLSISDRAQDVIMVDCAGSELYNGHANGLGITELSCSTYYLFKLISLFK